MVSNVGPVGPVRKPGTSTSGQPNNQGNGKSNAKKQQPKQPNSIFEQLKKGLNNAQANWNNAYLNEVSQFKSNPGLYLGTRAAGVGGFMPGAVGAGLAAAESYGNTLLNGGSKQDALKNAGITAAATAGIGKVGSLAGKAISKTGIGKAVTENINKQINNVTNLVNNSNRKLAPAVVGNAPPKINNPQINVPVKGQGTSHNITPDVMRREISKGTQPGEIVSNNTVYKWNKDTKKYNPTNITGVDKVQRYRENELYKKLKRKGYDMSLNSPYVDGAGQLTPLAWMDNEADNFIPHLYRDTENYVHATDHGINPGNSLESKYRGIQEMWDDRGGDLGFGGYAFSPNDRINGVSAVELFSPEYLRGMQGHFMDMSAPARNNFLRTNTPLKNQSSNVINAITKESRRLGNDDYLTKAYLEEKPFGDKYMDDPYFLNNGIIHDLPRIGDLPSYLDRRYGVPGIRGGDGYPQYVIGNENYNTFIKGDKPVVNERIIREFADDGGWYDAVENTIKNEHGDVLLNVKPADVDLAKKRFPLSNPNSYALY